MVSTVKNVAHAAQFFPRQRIPHIQRIFHIHPRAGGHHKDAVTCSAGTIAVVAAATIFTPQVHPGEGGVRSLHCMSGNNSSQRGDHSQRGVTQYSQQRTGSGSFAPLAGEVWGVGVYCQRFHDLQGGILWLQNMHFEVRTSERKQ